MTKSVFEKCKELLKLVLNVNLKKGLFDFYVKYVWGFGNETWILSWK